MNSTKIQYSVDDHCHSYFLNLTLPLYSVHYLHNIIYKNIISVFKNLHEKLFSNSA